MSTQVTIAGTTLNFPDGYETVEPMPFDAPGSVSFLRKTPGAICNVTLAPLADKDAMPYGDVQAVVDDIHASIDDDQGLIEVESGQTGAGHPYIYSIVRTNFAPDDQHYGLKLDLKGENGAVRAEGHFDTMGASSYRDSLVMSRFDTMPEGWFRDPFDPYFALGNVMNQSEERQYDADFPDHPLSQLRHLISVLVGEN